LSDNYDPDKAVLRSLQSNAFNIQALLTMASAGQNTDVILDKITLAIKFHLERVESLGILIPDENKQDHQELLAFCDRLEADWRNKKISSIEYAEGLNLEVFNHFTNYFKPLIDSFTK
jgi:hypothetical protein